MASPEHEDPENPNFVPEIDYNEIEQLEAVGEGSFGVVYKGIWRGKYVAVKKITAETEKKAFSVEVRQLSRVDHENIVKLYGVCTKVYTCLVMEYAEGGSLFNVLHCAPKIHYTMAHAMSWLYQCAKGVEYLHNMKPKPLIHRDLKPPNLLLINGGTLLKICDFGTAADKSTYMTNSKGSAAWMAPEVFTSSNYTEKCDVFSWGIILWQVLSRRKPFYNVGGSAYTIMWAVYKGIRPPLIRHCPDFIENLMLKCWDQDPMKRPNMYEIVGKMEFICGLLPNCDELIETDCVLNEEFYDEEELPNNCSTYSEKFDVFPTQNGNSNVKLLPQPSSNMTQPLNLQISPSAWELDEDFDEMRLQTMPGFDKMVPKKSSTKTVQAGSECISTTKNNGDDEGGGGCSGSDSRDVTNNLNTDANLDQMYLLLDPHLRPATPDLDDSKSMQLFEEHKQMAQEYLKVQTELALLSQRKDQLLADKTEKQQRCSDYLKQLQNEKESLIMVKELLKNQKDLTTTTTNNRNQQQSSNASSDSWVLVPRGETNNNNNE